MGFSVKRSPCSKLIMQEINHAVNQIKCKKVTMQQIRPTANGRGNPVIKA